MSRIEASIAALLALSLAGCGEGPAGTWVGRLSETRSLAIIESQEGSTAQVRRLGGGETAQGVEVRVREIGDGRYSVALPSCTLELSADDGEHLRVGGSPSCELTFEGWTGTFQVRGDGFIENGALTLQLMGSTSGPGASGGFSWRFHGRRAD